MGLLVRDQKGMGLLVRDQAAGMGRLAQEATVRTATAPMVTGRRAMARAAPPEKGNDLA
jgi:hypothetical protein